MTFLRAPGCTSPRPASAFSCSWRTSFKKTPGSRSWSGSGCWMKVLRLILSVEHDTRSWIEDQPGRAMPVIEVEETSKAASLRVRRGATEPAEIPVVLDEAQDR